MEQEKKEEINYTKEAFLSPVNLICLLTATVTALVMSNFSSELMITSTILTFTFGMELIYLGVVPKLPAYQKNVRLKKQSRQSAGNSEKELFFRLETRAQKRFLMLKHIAKEIRHNFKTLPFSTGSMLEHIEKKIEDLLNSYLILLDMERRYSIYIHSEVEKEIKSELEKEEELLNGIDSETLKKTRERRISILKKRLRKFDLAKEKYLISETHLETIEDAIRYIYEQSMTLTSAEEVGTQLDHLLTEMEETTQLIDEMDQALLPGFVDLDKELELAKLRKEAETLKKETPFKVKEKS
ncbi:MAG: hypothetical protein EA360_03800 [Balneolaceae bacterium]|nr:MAG: hypothetical protein EA360_03800 [Balneolaceae bacterium]